MLARLDKDVLLRHPRVVLIMAGLNDAAWVDPGPKARTGPRVPEAEFEKNLTEIVEKVRKAKATPVLLTPNPMTRAYRYQKMPFYQENDINDGLAPYADAVRRVSRVTGACLVDIFADWSHQNEHRQWIPDGLHPNAEGHRRIAAKVMESCATVMKPAHK
jgi:lysophospholipase L1-like esterase